MSVDIEKLSELRSCFVPWLQHAFLFCMNPRDRYRDANKNGGASSAPVALVLLTWDGCALLRIPHRENRKH